jgi:hypothetical protein
MKIDIKNLNYPASIYFVKSELEKQGIPYDLIGGSEIKLAHDLSDDQVGTLTLALRKHGLKVTEKKEKSVGKLLNASELTRGLYQFSQWGI